MTATDLLRHAEQLEAQIAQANPSQRLALQPRFRLALERLRAAGGPVPVRLHALDTRLNEEVIESYFDNMPV